MYASKWRIEKKKYSLHPGTTDYMDRFLDEQENFALQSHSLVSPTYSSLQPYTRQQSHGAYSIIQYNHLSSPQHQSLMSSPLKTDTLNENINGGPLTVVTGGRSGSSGSSVGGGSGGGLEPLNYRSASGTVANDETLTSSRYGLNGGRSGELSRGENNSFIINGINPENSVQNETSNISTSKVNSSSSSSDFYSSNNLSNETDFGAHSLPTTIITSVASTNNAHL